MNTDKKTLFRTKYFIHQKARGGIARKQAQEPFPHPCPSVVEMNRSGLEPLEIHRFFEETPIMIKVKPDEDPFSIGSLSEYFSKERDEEEVWNKEMEPIAKKMKVLAAPKSWE